MNIPTHKRTSNIDIIWVYTLNSSTENINYINTFESKLSKLNYYSYTLIIK